MTHLQSGIYALVDLAGNTVSADDAAILGLSAQPAAMLARGHDVLQPDAISVAATADRHTTLLGYLDEPEVLARALGLAASVSAAAIAHHMLDRHGAHACRAMRGEWSLFDWRRPGTVTLLTSLALRDPILIARSGTNLAIAPDLDRLARLRWVGRDLDPVGLGLQLGGAAFRSQRGDRTMLGGVRTLAAGTLARHDRDTDRSERIAPFVPAAPFRGSFDDAIAAADEVMHGIMRRTLARTNGASCLLSGGLDSSIIAWFAAADRRADQPLVFLSSAAPVASGLPDETGFAQIVADHLDLPMERVAPGDTPSTYRPSDLEMSSANGPALSIRHYLYHALYARATALGLPVVLNGELGELTFTAGFRLATPAQRLRIMAGRLLRRVRAGRATANPFQVRLAPHRLAALSDLVAQSRAKRDAAAYQWSPSGRWGYLPGAEKVLSRATGAWQGRIRMEVPFRDPRLLDLFATFPASFAEHGGVDRSPARHLLRDRLPDAIRLREKGLPFSPDYGQRLRDQAAAARLRIPLFRAADVGDWLDLDWLDERLAATSQANTADPTEAQVTALAAEYLLWWRSR